MFRRENRRESKKSGYIFTVKKHPEKGIMSVILGIISSISIAIAVYLSYRRGGDALPQYGAAIFLAMLFSLAGMVLGWVSRMEKDNYYLFPHLGIGLNLLSLTFVSMILYSGI